MLFQYELRNNLLKPVVQALSWIPLKNGIKLLKTKARNLEGNKMKTVQRSRLLISDLRGGNVFLFIVTIDHLQNDTNYYKTAGR